MLLLAGVALALTLTPRASAAVTHRSDAGYKHNLVPVGTCEAHFVAHGAAGFSDDQLLIHTTEDGARWDSQNFNIYDADGDTQYTADGSHAFRTMLAGDIDNDGDDDLLVNGGRWTGAQDHSDFWLRNDNGTFVHAQQLRGSTGRGGAAIGDMNGDGLMDVALSEAGGGLWIYLGTNNSAGALFDVDNPITVGGGLIGDGDGLVGDFDGDGTIDLLWKKYNARNPVIWNVAAAIATAVSSGTNHIGSRGEVPGSARTNFIAAGSADGDDRVDLFEINGANQNDRMLEISPGGAGAVNQVSIPSSSPLYGRCCGTAIFADMDNDCKEDLVLVTNTNNNFALKLAVNSQPLNGGFPQDASARFDNPDTLVPPSSANGLQFGLADFDHDGHLDIAVGHTGVDVRHESATADYVLFWRDGGYPMAARHQFLTPDHVAHDTAETAVGCLRRAAGPSSAPCDPTRAPSSSPTAHPALSTAAPASTAPSGSPSRAPSAAPASSTPSSPPSPSPTLAPTPAPSPSPSPSPSVPPTTTQPTSRPTFSRPMAAPATPGLAGGGGAVDPSAEGSAAGSGAFDDGDGTALTVVLVAAVVILLLLAAAVGAAWVWKSKQRAGSEARPAEGYDNPVYGAAPPAGASAVAPAGYVDVMPTGDRTMDNPTYAPLSEAGGCTDVSPDPGGYMDVSPAEVDV